MAGIAVVLNANSKAAEPDYALKFMIVNGDVWAKRQVLLLIL